MKKLLVVLLMLAAMNASAQWQPDVRLTNDPAPSFSSNQRGVAASGSIVHVVWDDNRDGNIEIYYKRSTDAGVSWGTDTRMTNNSFWSLDPSIAVSDTVVHIVWYDNQSNSNQIHYKRSTDAGLSWKTDTLLTHGTSWSAYPTIAVSGSIVHVLWYSYRDGNEEIYYKRSTNSGISWGSDIRLTYNNADSQRPYVAASESDVHVVWEDTRDGNYQIYYKRSTDAGVSWGADTPLTNNNDESLFPSITVSGSFVHIVWNMVNSVQYKCSTNSGLSWRADTLLTNTAAYYSFPSIIASGTAVHVVWQDQRNNWKYEIYYKYSTNAGVSWETDTRLTYDTSRSYRPSIAVSGSIIHVVWEEYRDGNSEIYYKRNPTGNLIGIQNISTETPTKYSLSQNYPNPFNPMCNVQFSMYKAGNVRLVVYDVQGREVQTLVDEKLSAGTYEVKFDGSMLNSGVYFYKLVTDGYSETKKMLLIK